MAIEVKSPEEVIAEILNAEYARLAEALDDIDLQEHAAELERRLWRRHQQDYVAWLRDRGQREIRAAFQHFIRARRASSSRTILRQFDEAVGQIESGEMSVEEVVDRWRINVGNGIERKLMDATGCDLDVEIVRQGKIASSAALEEAFYSYLRKRTPDAATVGSVMSAAEVVRIRCEVFGEKVVQLAQAA